MMTLRELCAAHPDWLDLPIVLLMPDGEYAWVGDRASVYVGDTEDNERNENVLVFDDGH